MAWIRAIASAQQAYLFQKNHIATDCANIPLEAGGEVRDRKRTSFCPAQKANALRCKDVQEFHRILKGDGDFAGRLSPRSSFPACPRSRPKNSLVLFVLIFTLFFLILDPPELMYFADETFNQSSICCKFHCLYFSHKMPVMIAMAVVITQHPSVVDETPSRVDVRETVGVYFSVLEPDLLF
jgi:hypothetical protein